MSRSVGALRTCAATAAGLVLLAGCGAEIVHVGSRGLSPDGPFAPPAGSATTRPTAQPSASVNGVIHFITGGGGTIVTSPSGAGRPLPAPAAPDADLCRGTSALFASNNVLSPEEVWPDQPGGTRAGVAVSFPTGCAFDLPAVPLFDCTIGFPWFSAAQMSSALANIGVVRLDIATLVYGQQGVTEYVLRLSGYAATDLTHMATTCDERQSALDAMRWTFRARTSQGVTTSLLRVNNNLAIALVFHGIPEDAKDALLDLATTNAGQR